MSLRVTLCIPSDGPTVASLQTSTVTRTLQLEIGTATMEALRNWLADQYPHLISHALAAGDDAKKVYLKVVAQHANDNTEEGEMISFAVWELPDDDMAPKDSGGIRARPPPGINRAFQRMICNELENMRNRVVNGRKCFCKSTNQRPTFSNWMAC